MFQANVVRITEDNEVIVEVYDSVDSDLKDATWQWLFVSSDGTVKVAEAKVGEDDQTVVTTMEKKDVLWYADRRNWTVGLQIDNTGRLFLFFNFLLSFTLC